MLIEKLVDAFSKLEFLETLKAVKEASDEKLNKLEELFKKNLSVIQARVCLTYRTRKP